MPDMHDMPTHAPSNDMTAWSRAERESVSMPVTSATRASVASGVTAELGPHPELAHAIASGEAKPSGPITNEAYERWVKSAELRVRLEVHIGQLTNLEDLLELAEESEDEFIERLSLNRLRFQHSTAQHLRIFRAIKAEIKKEIGQTAQVVAQIRRELADVDKRPTMDDGLTDKTGDAQMIERPLDECDELTATEATKLKQVGVHTIRDFVEHFYLPEQHEALAAFLGRTVDDTKELVNSISKQFPAVDLSKLVEGARRPRTFGALPPNDFEGTNP